MSENNDAESSAYFGFKIMASQRIWLSHARRRTGNGAIYRMLVNSVVGPKNLTTS